MNFLKGAVAFVFVLLLNSCDGEPKSGYETSYDLCMSYPATQAMPDGAQQAHCNEVASNMVYGTGASDSSQQVHVDRAAESNRNAFNLCSAIDASGGATEPCRVSGRSVIVMMPMAPSEAKRFCLSAVSQMHRAGASFEPGWSVQVRSPYSNGSNTATCEL